MGPWKEFTNCFTPTPRVQTQMLRISWRTQICIQTCKISSPPPNYGARINWNLLTRGHTIGNPGFPRKPSLASLHLFSTVFSIFGGRLLPPPPPHPVLWTPLLVGATEQSHSLSISQGSSDLSFSREFVGWTAAYVCHYRRSCVVSACTGFMLPPPPLSGSAGRGSLSYGV